MKVLFVDTTTADLVCAIVGDKTVTVCERNLGTHHSEVLTQKVRELFEKANVSFADLDAYAVNVGPGSFTGIRIGISTVKGFATAVKKPLIPVCSLEAISLSKKCGKRGSAVIDAGNGYYFADYNQGVSPCLVGYDDKRVKKAGKQNGAISYFDGAETVLKRDFLAQRFGELSPVYIRKSQAEENR